MLGRSSVLGQGASHNLPKFDAEFDAVQSEKMLE